jgi:hypothetical protein
MTLWDHAQVRRARRLGEVASSIAEADPVRARRLRQKALRYLALLPPWNDTRIADLPESEARQLQCTLDGRLLRTAAVRWVVRHRRRIAAAAVGVGLSAAVILSFVPGARRVVVSPNLAIGKAWLASSALDGWNERGVLTEDEGPSALFHTREQDSPWVMVDLGSAQRVRGVEVKNRVDCCHDRALPLGVEVSKDGSAWKRVAYRRVEFRSWDATLTPTEARFVRLRVDRSSYLHLAWIAVY